jgi:Ras-related protein Rab-23
VCYSTADRESFDHVEGWISAVEDECGQIPMVLVQTKIDLIDNAAMTAKEAEALAKKYKLPLFRTCARDNVMITELFEYLAVKYFSKSMT